LIEDEIRTICKTGGMVNSHMHIPTPGRKDPVKVVILEATWSKVAELAALVQI
jgi:hypothetical protein